MGRINVGRVVFSGIIVGVIINIIEDVMNGAFLAGQWDAAMASFNRPPIGGAQMVLFNVWGLIIGLAAAWIYAGFRPRFGAGPKTAVAAALTTWVLAYALAYFALAIFGYPVGLMITIGVVGLFEIVIATLIGARFYREEV